MQKLVEELLAPDDGAKYAGWLEDHEGELVSSRPASAGMSAYSKTSSPRRRKDHFTSCSSLLIMLVGKHRNRINRVEESSVTSLMPYLATSIATSVSTLRIAVGEFRLAASSSPAA